MQAVLQRREYEKGQVLYMALELSEKKWQLGFSDGAKLRRRTVTAGDRVTVLVEIAEAKARFKLGAEGQAQAWDVARNHPS